MILVSSAALSSSSARYSSSLPGKCWYSTGLLTPARSAISSIAAAWYPWATKTSRAAPKSCRRRAGFGSRVPTVRAWGVAVTTVSDPLAGTGRTPLSTVVVLVELHLAPLFGGIGLINVERQLSRFLPGVRIGVLGPLLVLGVGRWLLQVAFAHRSTPSGSPTASSRSERSMASP